MKKIIGVCGALLAVVGLLSGCSADTGIEAEAASPGTEAIGGGGNELIYGIYKAGDQTWFIDEGEAARAQAEEMGANFTFVDAKMSSEETLVALDNAIANNADGILICVPDQTMSQVVVDKLAAANIPVIAVDDPLIDGEGNKIAPWVGIDGYTIGSANGEWLANYVLENNLQDDEEVGLMMLTMDTVSSVVPRTEGARDAFLEVLPEFEQSRIFNGDTDGTAERGNTVATALITANPQITTWLVLTGNEEIAIGAVRALETAGLDNNAAVVGLGGYLAYNEWTNRGSDVAMRAAAFFSAEQIGRTSMELLLNHIRTGAEIPMETAIDAVMVTPDNFREVMGE